MSINLNVTKTEIEVFKLIEGQLYEFKVFACNSFGESTNFAAFYYSVPKTPDKP